MVESVQPIVKPREDQLDCLVAPYLRTCSGLGFAIGYASPSFANCGGLYFKGNIQNQFGLPLTLDGETPFEISSITKTFTATLYTLLIRASDATKTIGDYILPKGPMRISSTLAKIKLDELVNYTSGLPSDNDDDTLATPPFWPQPFSMQHMLSFLDALPPCVSQTGKKFTYSNLAFAIMSAIIASHNGKPREGVFVNKIREHIFDRLFLHGATFFDEVSLIDLPLGFHYESWPASAYTAMQPGHALFPAHFGAGGIVATPNDMLKWLLFNMGITQDKQLTPLLPVLQTRSTCVTANGYQLGLGWFINPACANCSGSISKDGEDPGFSSYIAFLPSAKPGTIPSQAGAFVLVNADSFPAAAAVANDVLRIMQNKSPLADKSLYPKSAVSRSQVRYRRVRQFI
jgi:D-alanyl-D-alanine-carboxypeptidase/D-alanyl-D-alanine-endopeptidase